MAVDAGRRGVSLVALRIVLPEPSGEPPLATQQKRKLGSCARRAATNRAGGCALRHRKTSARDHGSLDGTGFFGAVLDPAPSETDSARVSDRILQSALGDQCHPLFRSAYLRVNQPCREGGAAAVDRHRHYES